ncbi:UDP-N-acetylmuramoyl-L-alanine--D-glutamate ligase [Aureitalea sp. L0-47]|uniref:UDP-N-acetylmuramoyl-L-alanine--D-glutamate ligase n=1 Tax=Aureitalea sp. L0-47 TaxID=2816962 RepID=UPI002237ADB5|nr:UDP-N-acetylmuramoyl-L-alanine--D-glutamate ligase [Aureitalea sp. L0-47]MCW5520070.1 UDP-N-acetylmuramoyl-L-alanine--D-glutamate ligase [Aureitalea sp. L0-47]
MQRLVVLGAGESGAGTAILGKKEGFEVFVSDYGTINNRYKEVLIHHEIEWEEGTHSEEKILNASLVMKSPGIPDTAPIVQKLLAKGVKVVSEIEFAYKYANAHLVGITGTNGKTTTANLTYQVLHQGGLDVGLGGNIGRSFAGMIAEDAHRYYVLELSSFQLDGIVEYRNQIAVLLNIVPDHLDRYEYDFSKYVEAKFRILMNQTEEDYFIYDADDPVIDKWLSEHNTRPQMIPFSVTKKLEKGTYLEDEKIIIKLNNTEEIMPIATLGLQGQHNIKNAMAASTVAALLRIRKSTIRESMENFQGVEHRLEKVLKINNVMYINDSKATNVNAAFYALDSMETPTVWIAGGEDKGNDYTELLPLVNEKVKAIICLGVDNEKIINQFGSCVDIMVETDSMKAAIEIAYKLATRGDTVLLSPACASFDLFKNFEDRGRQFKEAVRNL